MHPEHKTTTRRSCRRVEQNRNRASFSEFCTHWIQRIFSKTQANISQSKFVDKHFSFAKPGHTMEDRFKARGGAQGRAPAGRSADRTVRKGDKRPLHPQSIEHTLMNAFQETRTSEIICKPHVETKLAVDKQFVTSL